VLFQICEHVYTYVISKDKKKLDMIKLNIRGIQHIFEEKVSCPTLKSANIKCTYVN
jgi:hypothetical protein